MKKRTFIIGMISAFVGGAGVGIGMVITHIALELPRDIQRHYFPQSYWAEYCEGIVKR